MKRLLYLAFLILSLAWQGCNRPGSTLLADLNEVIAPLPEDSPQQYEDQYLDNLLPWDNYSVIGLGEATHGTLDFVELRQRLFRFLVEKHNCRILAYEYSYRKSLLVNDYIHHKHNDLDSLFMGDLWIQDNYMLRQFVSWMREYNAGREEHEQIHFIGIDNQVDAMELEAVLQQIETCLPALALDRDSMPYNVPGKRKVSYENISETEYKELEYAFTQLKKQVESYGLPVTAPREKLNAEVALELIRALQASHEFLYMIYAEGENIRDKQLAENVLRIVNSSETNGPVALWAHNAHVANNPHYTQDGSPAMGWYLRDSLKESYLSVATSFSLGQFTAVMLDSAGNDTPPLTCQIMEDPPPESLNALFNQSRFPQFSLDIRGLDSSSALYRYLDYERPMIGVGDLYLGSPELHFTDDRIINLVEAHDLLFYFSETRPLL